MNRKLENYGFTPGQTSSMKRCRGFFFSCSRVASHARRRRKPSMSISSISFMRQAVAESSGESGRTIGSYSSRSVSRADRALASFALPHSQSARAGLASHQPEVYTFLSIAILDMLNIMGLDGGRAHVVTCSRRTVRMCLCRSKSIWLTKLLFQFPEFFPEVLPSGNSFRINQ